MLSLPETSTGPASHAWRAWRGDGAEKVLAT